MTQAAATPFAAAERGRRRISEELGGETLPRTRPGLSDLLGTARSHASPLGPLGGVAAPAAADTPRIGVGNAGRLPSPPCPRIKVMPPEPRDHDSARPGLSGSACGLRIAQAAVTFLSAVPARGCTIRTRFGAWERRWEVTTVFQFGHIGVEPTPFL